VSNTRSLRASAHRAPLHRPAPRAVAICVAVGGVWLITACAEKAPEHASTEATARHDSTGPVAAFHVSAEQRARLQIVSLTAVTYRPTVEATGTVAFNGDHSTQVIAPISGPVVRLVAQIGAQVHRGEALATVSSPDFASAVATYRKADVAVRNTQRILDLDDKLFANDAIARSDLDQARTDATSALADRDASVSQLRSLGIDAATITAIHDGRSAPPVEGVMRAPISGTVVERLINPGQLLQAGATLAFTIADLNSMWVLASVYGSDLATLHQGDRVDVITDVSPTPLSGRVDFVAAIVDPGTRATTVRVLVGNSGRLLRRDMFVRLRFRSTVAQTGMVVPSAAILRDDENLPFVFVANADGGFSRQRITLGTAVDGGYALTDGLQPGARILANGALFLQFAEHQ
jgi:membrane fusion protein, heavy metal efflux system